MFKSYDIRTKQNLEQISFLSASLVVILFIRKKKKKENGITPLFVK